MQIDITVRDTVSGLRSITIVESSNAAIVTPFFVEGTTDPVVVTATKINQTQSSSVVIRACAVNGCCGTGDPVITILEIPNGSRQVRQKFAGIPEEERFIEIQNGDDGLRKLLIKVNNERFATLRLSNNEEMTVDISSVMMPGDNTITLIGRGKPGDSALVIIADDAQSNGDENSSKRLRGKGLTISPQISNWQNRPEITMVWGKQIEL